MASVVDKGFGSRDDVESNSSGLIVIVIGMIVNGLGSDLSVVFEDCGSEWEWF